MLYMPAQARDDIVLCRDSQHRHLSVKTPDRANGPFPEIKSYKEDPGIDQRYDEGPVCMCTFAESHTKKGLRGDGLCCQWSATQCACDHCERLSAWIPRGCRPGPSEKGDVHPQFDGRGSSICLLVATRRTATEWAPGT